MIKKKRILLIDDEKDYCYFMSRNLEDTGEFSVIMAHEGREGIKLAKSEKPDLILLDIILPGLPGTDVANVLLNETKTKRIPIIFLTAIVTQKELGATAVKEIGGNNFIAKTAQTKDVVAAIKTLLHM
ncbi:MAG: response regulator [Candidatus Susulua stagnicola]|nr:response regulator [Candidatus Susulua stagnicola]